MVFRLNARRLILVADFKNDNHHFNFNDKDEFVDDEVINY
jgi:hypothetical protein